MALNISEFSIQELKRDLAAIVSDIGVCETALAAGVTHYGDGKGARDVKYRLEANQKIQVIIETELKRREEAK